MKKTITKAHSGNYTKCTNVRWHGASCPAYYADGQAHVWDSVAGHYTTCHSLTESQVALVRRLANRD